VASVIAVALGAGYAAIIASDHCPSMLLAFFVDLMPPGSHAARNSRGRRSDRLHDDGPLTGTGRADPRVGGRVLAENTVPFALWCADRNLDALEEALWATVSGLGDRVTTCAIVGGIVACAASRSGTCSERVGSSTLTRTAPGGSSAVAAGSAADPAVIGL
jgi:ADP-ribosylglycohydrolase